MDQEKFYVLGLLVLLYLMATVILVNRIILYKSFKTSELQDSVVNGKIPYLISANLSLTVSLFVLFGSLMNIITFQLNETPSFLELFSWSSIVLIISACALLISYFVSLLVMKLGLKLVNSIVFSILWFCFNSAVVILFNYIYTQISKSDAFAIF